MTKRTTIDSIITLNGKGVALLHDGKSLEACIVFRQALKDIAVIIKASKAEQQNQDADDDALLLDDHKKKEPSAKATMMMTTGKIRYIPVSVHQDVSILETCFSPENMFNFYHKAFNVEQVSATHVAADADACTMTTGTSSSAAAAAAAAAQLQLSATLIYNWGVASHCVAICNGKSEFLQKALLLYNKAFGVLQYCCGAADDNNSSSSSSINKETRLLRLALLNNMEHVNCYFGNMDNVDALQDYLYFVLHHEETNFNSSLEEYGTKHHDADDLVTNNTLVEEEEQFFYYSTVLWEDHHNRKDPTQRRRLQSPAPAA